MANAPLVVADNVCPRRSSEVYARKVRDDTLILHAVLKQYYVLNSLAGRIWDLADGTRTVVEIADQLALEFEEDRSVICSDLRTTLAGLKALHLIEVPDGP